MANYLADYYIAEHDEKILADHDLIPYFIELVDLVSPGIKEAAAARYSMALGLTHGGGVPDDVNAIWQKECESESRRCQLAKDWILLDLVPALVDNPDPGKAPRVTPRQLVRILRLTTTPVTTGSTARTILSRDEARVILRQIVRTGQDPFA